MDRPEFETATAIVLITAEPGREADVMQELEQIPEVKEAMLLFGEYDLFAKVECSDFGSLGNIVIASIRAIDGVELTKTLTAAPNS
ncbi:MAG: Lrp/AsnC ligand binding domain-containing protein [Euryarchaeota archaeon]|jgi:DNA-binding Lrp family transcriptional regulator|nr:Lrp/AsnC ligand binding domain-containing protein [Euryarchaeota archaeon]